MSISSSVSPGLQEAFNKYSKFGKTQAQIMNHNGLRIGSAAIQKMMKDCSLIDLNYTSQLLDNDIASVLGKLTTNINDTKLVHYPRGTRTFEIMGFKHLIERVAESKGVSSHEILAKINENQGPSLNRVTGITNKEITGRMTDTTYYRGTHKEHVDEDCYGKGKEGRMNDVRYTGYIQGLKCNHQSLSKKICNEK